MGYFLLNGIVRGVDVDVAHQDILGMIPRTARSKHRIVEGSDIVSCLRELHISCSGGGTQFFPETRLMITVVKSRTLRQMFALSCARNAVSKRAIGKS